MLRGGFTIKPREQITWADLEKYEGKMKEGGALVLYTGWSKKWCSAEYFAHPYLTRDAAEGITARGVKILGVDTLSPDETPEGVSEKGDFVVHETVLGRGGLIVENLANVDALLRGGNDASDEWSVSFVNLFHCIWVAWRMAHLSELSHGGGPDVTDDHQASRRAL